MVVTCVCLHRFCSAMVCCRAAGACCVSSKIACKTETERETVSTRSSKGQGRPGRRRLDAECKNEHVQQVMFLMFC